MNQQKIQEIAIKVVVTFVEAAGAYWIASGGKVSKLALAGVMGAGLSAVYNLGKHYLTTPTT